MKVALVHDYIKEYGGAERVLEALHEIYPEAPVYTSVYLPKFLGPHKKRFKDWKIKTSFLQRIPLKGKLISPLRLIAPFAFKSFDFSEYDVVIISATGAYFPNIINKGKAKLICYCHTPPRYLYGYKTAREWKKNMIFKVAGESMNHFLRILDFNTSQNVDYFISNSEEVASRIRKFYRKDAVVIYPPVNVSKISTDLQQINTDKNQRKFYYLAGGRLARAKGVDIIVEAFSSLGMPLKVFGRGFAGYETELRSKITHSTSSVQKSKIEFVGEVTDGEKLELMKNAKAYVFAAYDEDFGITPVEAMSVGTPVIAYESGGVKETVIDGETGIFYKENTQSDLIDAVRRLEKMKIRPEDCIKQAQKFSKEKFKKEIENFINSKLKITNHK